MRQGLYDNLSNKCKTAIKQNNPGDSVNIISNMKIPGSGEKIGKTKAIEIYKLYSDESVKYDTNKHKNNINSYKNEVKKNINKTGH